jgi:hypothetical protein
VQLQIQLNGPGLAPGLFISEAILKLIPFTNLRLTLADGWEKLHKRGTVIAGAAFTALAGAGPLISQAWQGMPRELRDVIPQNVQQWIAYTLFGLTFIAIRYTSVRRVPKVGGEGTDHA